jgi:hypothetical protein
VWILINEGGVGGGCDSNSDGMTDAADYAEICLDATTLDEADASTCASLNSGKAITMIGIEGAPTPTSEPIYLYDPTTLKTLTQDALDMPDVAEFK